MQVAVAHPSELGQTELTTWRDFQRSRPGWANPFLSPEFTLAVGRLRPQARVGVLFDGHQITGFFPFEKRPLGYGVPIAAGLTDCQGLVHAPDLDWDPQELLRRCDLAVWEFDHLVDGQRPFAPYEVLRSPSPIIDIRGGFDSYMAERRRGSPMVRDLPRKRRRLAREVGEVRFVFDSRDREALRTVLAWKSAQYQRTGRADRFAHPWIVALIEQLLEERTADFSGLLSLLYAGDHLVAGHFGLRSNRVIPTWFPAYDTRFGRHSPGLLLHLAMAEGAAHAGVDHIDMGRGPKSYKESLKSRDLAVAEGRVVRRVPAAALHWARRVPVRRLRNVVTDHPALFRAADRLLQTGGRVRTTLQKNSQRNSSRERIHC
ncbi:GNAT family N-acetyltransferase [Pseudonocardia sp. H11422]|uniref:GNAT family N-acetyltransferase n=1 Tax=Pseudonocardia sp. H11422 TaxID=2835866 RepID=UPI001BDDB8CB|nr:GNAT family N-acetyltransferase [Pseudonocardia sp. H11422]